MHAVRAEQSLLGRILLIAMSGLYTRLHRKHNPRQRRQYHLPLQPYRPRRRPHLTLTIEHSVTTRAAYPACMIPNHSEVGKSSDRDEQILLGDQSLSEGFEGILHQIMIIDDFSPSRTQPSDGSQWSETSFRDALRHSLSPNPSRSLLTAEENYNRYDSYSGVFF